VLNIKLRNKLARFLKCELDCNSGRLSVDGHSKNIEPMVYQFLLLLIENQGTLVSKQKVIDTLWPNKDPSDAALRAMVKKAREALNDDARNSSYIKTMPTKGYLLIPPVELVSTVLSSWVNRHARISAGLGLIFALLVFSVTWYVSVKPQEKETIEPLVIEQSILRVLDASDVSTYYINGGLKNVWVDNAASRGVSQLVVENITNKQQQKLVFNARLKSHFWYSQGSQRLLVMRNDSKGVYSIHFNRQNKEPTIIEYKFTLPENLKVLAIDSTGNQLFVLSSDNQSLGLFALASGKEVNSNLLPPAIIDIPFQLTKLVGEESSNLSDRAQANIHIWPSPITDGFVVSLSFRNKQRLLYYRTVVFSNMWECVVCELAQ
jgi:DNA-binding winged helix-turn-helix (wHTH) protein